MRRVIALATALTAAAVSQVAIASVSARGDSVVIVAGGEGEPAVDWDIEVTGGSPSANHITLAPIAIGFEGEFTVAVERARATVTLTTLLPADGELASVGCLDDLFPPTEISPVVDPSGFTLEIVPGRRYRCFVVSGPVGGVGGVGATVQPTQAGTDHVLPRSDASATSEWIPGTGWPTVVVTLVAILGVALLLRPARR